jgi:hypothetical protein
MLEATNVYLRLRYHIVVQAVVHHVSEPIFGLDELRSKHCTELAVSRSPQSTDVQCAVSKSSPVLESIVEVNPPNVVLSQFVAQNLLDRSRVPTGLLGRPFVDILVLSAMNQLRQHGGAHVDRHASVHFDSAREAIKQTATILRAGLRFLEAAQQLRSILSGKLKQIHFWFPPLR